MTKISRPSTIAALILSLAACGASEQHDNSHEAGHTHDKGAEQGHEEATAHTEISAQAAQEAGLATAVAGEQSLSTVVDVLGWVSFAPGAEASVKARFPGKILSLAKNVGDTVSAGAVLARIEANQSLQTYAVTAPIGGVIFERAASPGDVAGEAPLYRIGDPDRLVADLHVFDRDMGRVRPGQAVEVLPVNGGQTVRSSIETFLPVKEVASQTVVARVPLKLEHAGWFPGMTVRGHILAGETSVPVAVHATALQRFRGEDVVFVRNGDAYAPRRVTTGRKTEDWVEIVDGLEAGETYVSRNSFLIKADILKSGASHAH
jgi:cobalt-zinc-cadmium efflux system membrane fusion protein